MNQKIKYGLIFSSGVAIGTAIGYFIMYKKYLNLIKCVNDEIDKRFDQNNDAIPVQEAAEKAEAAKNKPDISTYMQNMNYADIYKPVDEYPDTEVELDESVEEEEDVQKYLYEITASEFASYTNDRTKVTLFWFLDDVFTNEIYERVDPREYLNGYLKLLDDNTPIDPIDYIRKMAKDEICIRDFDSNLDMDICTQAMSYSDYMSTE